MSQQHSSFARPSQPFLVLNSSMDAPPRPIEPDLSLPDFGDLQPKVQHIRSSNANDAYMRNPRQQLDPLSNWYTSQQGPWDPLRSNANVVRPNVRGLNTRPGSVSFAEYRSQTLPSESDTTAPGQIPSDSGYGSWTRQSVADASVFGDCDQSGETASISSHIAGIHFDRPMVSPPDVWSHQQSANNGVAVTIDNSKRPLVCGHCRQRVKTRSELKKHEQKHTKPYHCDVADCTRREGFSTPNDVDRHMRSCHPDAGTRGKYFKCTIECCRKKDKKWPRADNFRQHLKRIHHMDQVDDIDKYICEPEVAPNPTGPDLAGLVSVAHDLIPLNINHNGMNSSSWTYNMSSVQHGTQGNDYMAQQMAFSQDDAPQQHDFMSSAGDHVPNNLMQMSPMGLDAGAPLAREDAIHTQSQGLQGLIVPLGGTQEASFEESSYFNEASISEEESERDDQSVIHHVSEPDLTSSENLGEGSRTLDRPASRGCEEPSVAGEDEDAPSSPNVIALDDDDSSSTSSTSPTSSVAGDAAMAPFSEDVPKPSQPQLPEAPLDFADVIKDQGKAFDFLKALKEKGLLEGLLQKVDYQVPEVREASAPIVAIPSGFDAAKNSYTCSEVNCTKSFPRQCELRKHLKRHAKPYSCTFPRCDKRFGSKNDWKRHENSQHYQLELWKCTEKSSSSKFPTTTTEPPACARVFNRREQFKTHLQREHRITDSKYVEQRLEDCLDGRNYEVRFWCGFCRKMVQVEERGLKAWLGRFNHIDGHFAGNVDMSEWKNPDPGLQEVDVVLMSPGDVINQATAPSHASAGAEQSGGRAAKRSAEAALHRPGPSKRARQNVLWYCCTCSTQQLAEIGTVCLTPSCRGHEQCDDCLTEILPSGNDE